MPSMLHEGIALLFENRSDLAPRLVERVLGVPLPAYNSVQPDDPTLSQAVPPEKCADGVVVLTRDGVAVLSIVLEVQLRVDTEKLFSWPLYAVTLRARKRCPVIVLVVAPDPRVARWASQPIGLGASSTFHPLVIGPDAVPWVTSIEEARENPELAVLSVLAHGREAGAIAVAESALAAVADLDEIRASFYSDLVLSVVTRATRVALEHFMRTKYEFQSEFVKKNVALLISRERR